MSITNKINYSFGRLPETMPVISNIDNYFNTAQINKSIDTISTHDIELGKSFENTLKVFHFDEQIEVESQKISFDYKLKSGVEYRRNAISMLKYCDYPAEIIASAENIFMANRENFTRKWE